MKSFVQCRSRAAYLPDMNIDTDAIFPARYLLLLDREGMGDYLFHDRKYRPDGSPNGAFVLDDPDFADAEILIAGTVSAAAPAGNRPSGHLTATASAASSPPASAIFSVAIVSRTAF